MIEIVEVEVEIGDGNGAEAVFAVVPVAGIVFVDGLTWIVVFVALLKFRERLSHFFSGLEFDFFAKAKFHFVYSNDPS